MSPVLICTDYMLVIDTDCLSDMFYKKLCAYCTGYVDEKEEDQSFSDLFYMELGIEDDNWSKGHLAEDKNPFKDFINQRLDEDQIYSPCCVLLNKRYGYNAYGEYALLTEENCGDYKVPAPMSVGIFFDDKPTKEHLEIIKSRCVKFFKDVWPKINPEEQVNFEGLRLICHTKYGQEIEI